MIQREMNSCVNLSENSLKGEDCFLGVANLIKIRFSAFSNYLGPASFRENSQFRTGQCVGILQFYGPNSRGP